MRWALVEGEMSLWQLNGVLQKGIHSQPVPWSSCEVLQGFCSYQLFPIGILDVPTCSLI